VKGRDTYLGDIYWSQSFIKREKRRFFSQGYLSEDEEGLSPRDQISPKEKEARMGRSGSKEKSRKKSSNKYNHILGCIEPKHRDTHKTGVERRVHMHRTGT
jgi:hypothetical protein